MNIETFIFDTPDIQGNVSGLKMCANRYTMRGTQPQDGFTLITCHGLGQHKEQWEPVLEKIFALNATKTSGRRVREVWALEWQSHGESFVLNKDLIGDNEKAATLNVWGAGIASFVRSRHVDGRRLVGLAFSAGCVALTLATKYLAPSMPFIGLILLDPSFLDADSWYSDKQPMFRAVFSFMKKGADARLDSWPSKAEAAISLRKTVPYNTWDARMLDLYVEHALYETTGKDGKRHVQRKCPGNQSEGGWYNNMECFWQATDQCDKIRKKIPVHLVLGSAGGKGGDVMLPAIREMLLDRKKGRTYASVSYISNVGHMLMQVKPDEVAIRVSSLLDGINANEVHAHL